MTTPHPLNLHTDAEVGRDVFGYGTVCLTCGLKITGYGHNPDPIGFDLSEPELADRHVCSDCNAMFVIPARLGHGPSGHLYDRRGQVLGTFGPRAADDKGTE